MIDLKKYPLKGVGTIVYDPKRPGMKKNSKWWCICLIDKEVTRYYRYWIESTYGLTIQMPPWNAHISIIRGEKPKEEYMDLWKKYHKKKIEFNYTHNVYPNQQGKFWAVEARCELFTEIRDSFGLPSDWSQHITVGKIYNPLDKISIQQIYKHKQ